MTSERWSDLKARVWSSIVMILVAGAAFWFGGVVFVALIVAMVGAMHWELGKMLSPLSRQAAWLSAMTAGGATLGFVYSDAMMIVLPITVLLQLWYFMSHRYLGALYSAMILLSGYVLIELRLSYGSILILWLIGLVILTDIGGYFAGRIIGGPKFWPRFSPKKTWSGAVAGWICAAGLTLYVFWGDLMPILSIAMGVALSFASQMGDIFESAMKRKSNVKDSSNLIPGHGGVLDRFDGVVGAALVFGFFLPLLMSP